MRWIYGNLNETAAADWLRSLQQAETGPVPTPEQSQFLQAIINRCLTETTEEQTQRIGKSEPWRGICHGVPGAGKSQTLKWLRRFFKELCGPPDGIRPFSPSKYPGRAHSGHDAACVREHPHQSQRPRWRTRAGARPIRPVPAVALARARRNFHGRPRRPSHPNKRHLEEQWQGRGASVRWPQPHPDRRSLAVSTREGNRHFPKPLRRGHFLPGGRAPKGLVVTH